jgi:phosphotransferase system  glucose/maltose/N-acetylglucosamine-specific IIC component
MSLISDNYFVVILSFIIVIFPALDTLSIFPLICNTLGNNLHSCFPESKFIVKIFSSGGEEMNRKVLYKRTSIMWRLISSIPPIIISLFVTDLSLSLQLAGICGIIVSLIIPALLQRYSKEKLNDLKLLSPTFRLSDNPYSSRFSGSFYVNVVLLTSFFCLAICMCQVLELMWYNVWFYWMLHYFSPSPRLIDRFNNRSWRVDKFVPRAAG